MENKTNDSKKPEFFAFARDSVDKAAVREFTTDHGWDGSCIMDGDISTATQYFKSNLSPKLLLVEIPSAEAAPNLLDELANVCDPHTKVIVIGEVNEYSFYCWLIDIGVFSYLLRPLTKDALETTYKKSIDQPVAASINEKEPTKIIAVVGARGGVGVSTIALNLSGIFAEHSDKKIALVDIDPQEGSLSLTLDIEPARGLRDALEKPDRIDPLFIDRVMNKIKDNLCLLSSEEKLKDIIEVGEFTADALLRELSNKYDIVILDIPRRMGKFERECLQKANNVLLVAELTLQSLRDTLRISDLMTDTFSMTPPMVVVNRAGMAPRNEMNAADFEKGITVKIVEKILYVPDLFMPISSDIPSIVHAKHAAMKPLYSLAKKLLPSDFPDEIQNEKSFLGFAKKKKKD